VRLKPWQASFAKRLARQLDNHGVVLLQLPTGFGKTAIVLNALRYWTKNKTRALIAISPPRQPSAFVKLESCLNGAPIAPAGNSDAALNQFPWTRDYLGFGHGACKPHGSFKVRSHRKLINELFTRGKRKMRRPNWARGKKLIVIIDEIHRSPSILRAINFSSQRIGITFLFLSATPVNPTQIDEETTLADYELDKHIFKERIQNKYLELFSTMFSFAKGKSQLEKRFIEYGSDSQKILSAIISELPPVPRPNEMLQFRPHPRISPEADRVFEETKYTQMAVKRLIPVMRRIDKIMFKRNEKCFLNKLILERLSVGCVSALSRFSQIARNMGKGKQYRPLTHTGVYREHFKKISKVVIQSKLSFKLDVLVDFIDQHMSQGGRNKLRSRILVFCFHRQTAAWLSMQLEARLKPLKAITPTEINTETSIDIERCFKGGGNRVIWDSISVPEKEVETLSALFNRSLKETGNRGLVLIATNGFSESLDLQEKCDILIHYELDWSPLRMLQRVGRLWRWKAFNSRSCTIPKFPHVYHLKYPCSVDEEIFCRLHERWKALSELDLGLDVVPFNLAVGKDLADLAID
jgi:hypothetical protein